MTDKGGGDEHNDGSFRREASLIPDGYRDRIFRNYASQFQDSDLSFDRTASIRWGKAYKYYLRGWLPKSPDADIIDLACGGGKLLHFLKDQGYRNIHGVDISPEQVELSRQIAPDVTRANILDYLEGRREVFDVMIGLDIIEHFSKDEAFSFLDKCFAALKPGGRLILQTPNADSPWGTVHRYGDFTHEICFNPNSLARILDLCGFRNVVAREQGPVPRGYSLKSTARAMAWTVVRSGLKFWNVVETGNAGSGIFSRTFIVSGAKV